MKKLHIASLATLLIAGFFASASVSAAPGDYDHSPANQRPAHHQVQKQQRHHATHPSKARHHKKHVSKARHHKKRVSKARHHRTLRHRHHG